MDEEATKEPIRLAETDAVTTDEDGTTRVKMALLDKSGRLDPEEIY